VHDGIHLSATAFISARESASLRVRYGWPLVRAAIWLGMAAAMTLFWAVVVGVALSHLG
jgi:hypothetical protein